MTDVGLAEVGASNLRETYLCLGRAVAGISLREEAGFRACTGPFEHPICNFALGLDLDPWSARRLREIALERSVFHVYSLAGDRPEHRDELLRRQGFEVVYRLIQMGAHPGDPGPYLEMAEARGPSERQQVATFMGGQFFTQVAPGMRRRVVATTAQSVGPGLFWHHDRGRPVAALMLSETAESVGLYNLCVATSSRGKGLGGAFVAWARAWAAERGKPVCLQCDARLAGWYEHLGFRRVGFVDVYALDKLQQADIMN